MDWLEPRNSLSRPAVVLYISSGYLYIFLFCFYCSKKSNVAINKSTAHQHRSSIDRKYLWDAQQKCWLNNIEIRRGIRLMNADSLSLSIHSSVSMSTLQCCDDILRWNKRFSLRERETRSWYFPRPFASWNPSSLLFPINAAGVLMFVA
jgi:hypothetical protein